MSKYVTDSDANDKIIQIKEMLNKGSNSLEIADYFNSNSIEYFENNGVWTKKDVDKIITDHKLDIKGTSNSTLWTVINWLLGVLFLFLGLSLLSTTVPGGVLFIGVSLLVLPIVRDFLFSKTNISIPTPARIIVSVVMFLVGASYIPDSNLQEFNENKDQIITEIQGKFEEEKYEEALSLTQKYEFTNNSEIISLNKQASDRVEKQRKEIKKKRKEEEERLAKKKEEDSLLRKIEKTDSDDSITMFGLYKKLVALVPGNAGYKNTLEDYDKKSKDAREKLLTEKTNAILERLKTTKSSEYKKNMDIYLELSELHSNNDKYKKELAKYTKKHTEKVKEDKIKAEKEEKDKRLVQLGLKWNYQESDEKMGRGTIKYASVSSMGTLNFDFPYRGSQRATLTLRKHPKHGKDVIIGIEKGQFTCSYNGCKVAVRFDKGKAINYSATESSDHSTTTLFINNYKSFVSRAKKSKRIYIEAEFYQEGYNVMEFNSEDLKF